MNDGKRNAGNLPRHELIGCRAEVVAAPDPTQVGVSGRVVDETQGTLVVATDAGQRTLPKRHRTFAFAVDGERVEVEGRVIAHRPKERTRKVRSW